MLNLLNKFLDPSKSRSAKNQRQDLYNFFMSQTEHEWLKNNSHMKVVFELLPLKLLEEICLKRHVLFMKREDFKTNSYLQRNIILVSGEYQKLLKSEKKMAVAYLAHEIALIVQEMDGVIDQQLLMEIEADKFVSDLGLTFELEELLMLFDETIDKRVRLSYLTSHHFSREH